MAPDHRQRGAKLGVCPECGRPVWSNQQNTMVTVVPKATFRHRDCAPKQSSLST